MKTFNFLTNSMEYQEVGMKGSKEYYVTGYISTDEIDRAGEIVTKDAMREMVAQIKSGNIKLDVEHSTFRGENDLPVGKIVDAGMDSKGVWVKCVLNTHHEKFKSLWNSIKEGFLDAFSIAYQVKDFVNDVVNGVNVKLLKSIDLLNVAITGNPVNPGAKMAESFCKSVIFLKDKEENTMTEEVKVEETPAVEEQPEVKEAAPVVEEAAPEVKEEAVEEEPKVEHNPLDDIKSLENQIVELKSLLDAQKEEFAAFRKEVEKPQLKAVIGSEVKEAAEQEAVAQVKSMLDLI
jgi:HK97 family phage prohead protease